MKKKRIKRGAHAITYLAAWWTLFSAFAVFDWFDTRRSIGDPNAIPGYVIWGIHLLLIAVSVYAWRNESGQETTWFGEDDEILDVKPEEINIEKEKAELKRHVLSQVVGTLWLMGFAWVSIHFLKPAQNVNWLPGVAFIFGGIMLLNIIYGIIKFAILWHRAKAANA